MPYCLCHPFLCYNTLCYVRTALASSNAVPVCFLLSRKAVGKDEPDMDPGPSVRGKRKAESDGGEEVFAKKSQLISANDLK